MLLFSDGFEYFHPSALSWKWDVATSDYWSSDLEDTAIIVFGEDTSVNPSQPFARKDGRALKGGFELYKQIRKSRTLFLGFAFRYTASDQNIKVRYYTKEKELICTATHYMRGDYVDSEWFFETMDSSDKKFTQVFCPAPTDNGDFHYIEFGFTIYGNNPGQGQAWVETRMGANRANRAENIYTINPDSAYDDLKHFISGIEIEADNVTIDDLYVCNDEGSFNNSFLGDVRIRARKPEADGTVQDGMPVNADPGGVFTALQTDHVRTDGEPLPNPEPTPSEDPLYLTWEDPTASHVQMKREEDEQLFRFSHPNFAGSEPRIFGAIAYVMSKTGPDNPIPNAKLTPLLKPFGSSSYEYGRDWIRSVQGNKEILQMAFENQEEVVYEWGQTPEVWNTTTLNNSEFGFRLDRFVDTADAAELRCLPFTRHKIDFDEKVSDAILVEDFCHRFWDKIINQSINFDDVSEYQYTWAFYDNLQINEEYVFGAKGCVKWINSVVRLDVNIPWYMLWLNEKIEFADAINLDWMQTVYDTLGVQDYAYGFWVEQFEEALGIADYTHSPMIFKALDGLQIGDAAQTNHELIEDGFDIAESYVWSGHEWLGETLYPDDLARVGILAEALESLDLEEDHFDGNWVQFDNHQFSLTINIETQQWRHEFFMGVIINSWQIEPIEVEPGDGDRTGQLTAEYWQKIGYASNPFED